MSKKIKVGDLLIDDRPSDYSAAPVFSSPEEEDAYFERETKRIKNNAQRKKMRVKYIGPDIGVDGLFNNGIYEVVEVDELTGMLRIIDESGEDYLYSPIKPKSAAGEYKGGYFEIIEDDNNTLSFVIKSNI